MSLIIRGLATAVPRHRVGQSETAEVAKAICTTTPSQRKMVDRLYRHTGIQNRHSVIGEDFVEAVLERGAPSDSVFVPANSSEMGPTTGQRLNQFRISALPLALEASALALERAKLSAKEITHLVTVSCTGFSAPGFDIGSMKALGMEPTVERTHVGFMGCHGAFNGLRVANALTALQRDARVLLCSVELCTLHFYYGWDPQRMLGNALFADGAGALVGQTATPGESDWQVAATGSCLFADSEEDMSWQIGDRGFDMMLSNRIPDLIASHLRPWLEGWLAENGLKIPDVGSWAIHPGGPRILSAVSEVLGLPITATDVSREVLSEFGNMSSATVLFILERLRDRNAPRPCVALGFGPGLVAEAVLLT